ncbi:uncharacterized protein LOC141630284 [Silene latifolia]|uniref:uncharacterized protein LOC141630284 n=1 Tax=Silene latifolia TaxID=37657 RepID=UPI003D7768C6
MEDFNNVLGMCERIGSEVSMVKMRDFQDCVANCGLNDLPAQGAFFTWTNTHEPGDMVFSIIDRAMTNDEWLVAFPDTTIVFQPEGLFDHCPCTINLLHVLEKRKDSFKYFNMWGADFEFKDTIKKVWDNYIRGYKMFQVMKLHNDPTNIVVQIEEREAATSFKGLEEARRRFLAQKAKVQWMEDGDDNTSYFHSAIKTRHIHNRILRI